MSSATSQSVRYLAMPPKSTEQPSPQVVIRDLRNKIRQLKQTYLEEQDLQRIGIERRQFPVDEPGKPMFTPCFEPLEEETHTEASPR